MSMVGEMMAGAVVKEITTRLFIIARDETALQWGFKEDVLKLEEKMRFLEAVMEDADHTLRQGRSNGGEVFGLWLTKVKSAAYDAENILDELDAIELVKKVQPKLKLFFSSKNQLYQQLSIPHNIKKLRKKIEEIQREVPNLNLVHHEEKAERTIVNETFADTSDERIQTRMVGRETQMEKIINLLLRSEASEDISIIPIIGIGGVGKSTLVESAFADKRVNVFDPKVWVHVSEHFNLQKIAREILKSINPGINSDNCSLHILNGYLQKELATTRYLIVLDDLWEEDGNILEKLMLMLHHGCNGSKILITTRNQSIVRTLSTGALAKARKLCPVPESEQIILGALLADECWEVIKQRAFGPGNDGQSVFVEIGKQIAAKCGGLPLVANSLGQIMFESSIQEWENIRDTKVDFGLRDENLKKTLECLMPSYYYMKMEFKMCFTYLAAFRRGFIISDRHLIQQWIALGYIRGENVGVRCIKYLIGMSFLQVSRSSSVTPGQVHSKAPRALTMHDLAHDLASVISANELYVLDANSSEPRTWNKSHNCRHVQLINYKNQPKVFKDFPAMVRSFHFRYSGQPQIPPKAFDRCKYIRVLELSGCSVGGESTTANIEVGGCSPEEQSTSRNLVLPSSINRLKLLRYLDATALPITSLPKSFHTLQNMQTLIMSKCSLETLHENICSLHELCHLDLSGNIGLSKLPLSLGKLSKLSFLNLFGCSTLQELPESICELTWLQYLDMSQCPAIQTLPDELGSLPKLILLNMSGCLQLTKLPDSVALHSLEHLNLSSCHKLEILPQDIGSLQHLAFLDLSDCYKLSVFPDSFCQLVHLKVLDLSDCHEFKELPERFGELSELHSLNLTSCCKLQLLPESFSELLNLRHLNLSYCMRLRNLPSKFGDLKIEILDISCAFKLIDLPNSLSNMTSLIQFEVTSASDKVFRMYRDIKKKLNFPSRSVHRVRQIGNRGCSDIVELRELTCGELHITNLQNVRILEDAERAKLRDKSDLRLLLLGWGSEGHEDKYVLERLLPPRTLERLFIYGYMSKDLPIWISQISSYLPSITNLSLNGLGTCDTLPPIGQLPNLRYLSMEKLPAIRKIGMEFYGESGPCMKLRAIVLRSMENLVEWWTTHSGQENGEFLIPNLHSLESTDCPKLKFLPYPPRSMTWYLDNSDEVIPEGGFRRLSSSAFPFDMALTNSNFSPDKWDRLQHFPSLESIQVKSCSGLRALPQAMQYFTILTKLRLHSLNELENLEFIGCLPCLQFLQVVDCPNLISLPESMKILTDLTVVWLKECQGLEVLPEWLGQLTSLQEINIINCLNLTFLPKSIRNLTKMKELYIQGCPSLVERCKGEDAHNISHIPRIILHGSNGAYVLIDGVRVRTGAQWPNPDEAQEYGPNVFFASIRSDSDAIMGLCSGL